MKAHSVPVEEEDDPEGFQGGGFKPNLKPFGFRGGALKPETRKVSGLV